MSLSESSAAEIMRLIYLAQPLTRMDVTRQSRLGFRRVSAVISSLLDLGLVSAESQPNNGVGRPPDLVCINPNAGRAVGIDLDKRTRRAVVTDLAGNVLASLTRPMQPTPQHADVRALIAEMASEVCAQAGVRPQELFSLGIALNAQVNPATGQVLSWPHIGNDAAGWFDMDVQAELSRHLQNQVVVIDDVVRARGMTAAQIGAACGSACFLYVLFVDGIGSALFLGGQPFRGAWGLAGHLGHIGVAEDGPWCMCGNRGCLEAVASASAILARYQERLTNAEVFAAIRPPEMAELTLAALGQAACQGDKLAYQVLDEAGGYVGRALAVALNLLGPELVVLGGAITEDNLPLIDAIRREVRLHSLAFTAAHTRIVCETPNEMAGAQGAALMAIDALFRSHPKLLEWVKRVSSAPTQA
jgi:predicted NBD/HSP70 family sugar kinase